jgi:hypothetical protein
MPDNTIEWGQGAVNNSNDWGKAKANSTNNFGAVYDSSPSGDTNIAGGSADFANNYSISFDGVDDVINFGLNAPFNAASTKFSISLWCKSPNSFTDSGNLVESRLSFANPDGIAIEFISNSMYFRKSGSTVGKTITQWGLNNSNWNHIVYVYDLTLTGNKIFVYINGTLLSSTPQAATSQPASTGDFRIADGLRGNFNGNIDEVGIFDYTLTALEVSDIYNATGTGKTSDLNNLTTPPISWYRMGDGDTFPTVNDNSGSSDGTMINMSSTDIVEDTPS